MQSLPKDKPDTYLPDVAGISKEEFGEAYPVWLLWRATERRFLPTELLAQPQALTDTLLTIDNLFEKMVNQRREAQERQNNK